MAHGKDDAVIDDRPRRIAEDAGSCGFGGASEGFAPRRLAARSLVGGDVARGERRYDNAARDRRAHIAEQGCRLRQPARGPQLLAVSRGQRIEHVVGRHEIDLSARRGRRAPDRPADRFRPRDGAVAGIDADYGAVAGRHVETPGVESQAAAEALPAPLVLGPDACRPDLGAISGREGRDCAAGVEGEYFAVGDERNRAQTPTGRGAGTCVGRPHLLHLVRESEVAEIVGRRAATLGSVMTAMRSPGSLSFSFLNGLRMSERPEGRPLQAATLKAVAAITPAPRRLPPIPRFPPRPTFEPPSLRERYFAVVLSDCGVPTMSASIILARSRKFGGVP